MSLLQCDITKATHVKSNDQLYEIREKYGLDEKGRVTGQEFGVITTQGNQITMWEAQVYYKKED